MKQTELAERYAEVLSLPIEERLLMIDAFWNSIDIERQEPVLSDEMRALLDKRIEDYESGKDGAIPFETALEELRNRP
jgi:putative addiction module component (TIGR02574 family)